MMTGDDEVVIADGIVEEIVRLTLVVESYHLLRAAKVRLGLVADELSFCNEMT